MIKPQEQDWTAKGLVGLPAWPYCVCGLGRKSVFRAPLDSSQLGKDHQMTPDQSIPDEPSACVLGL